MIADSGLTPCGQNVGSLTRRAISLALAEDGVPIDRLELIARGRADPVYFESDPTGEAGNRRVEVWFTR